MSGVPDGTAVESAAIGGLLGGAGGAVFGAGASGVADDLAGTADDLTRAAQRASSTVGPGKGAVHGTQVHSAFRNEVNAIGNGNLSSEVSYLNGDVVRYGTPGSIRCDAVKGPVRNPTAVFDLKTGGATLSPARMQQIQDHLPAPGIPVIQIKP